MSKIWRCLDTLQKLMSKIWQGVVFSQTDTGGAKKLMTKNWAMKIIDVLPFLISLFCGFETRE